MKTLHRTVMSAFGALVASLIVSFAVMFAISITPCLALADSCSGTLTYTENGISKTETFQTPRDLINAAKTVSGDVVIDLLEDWDTGSFLIDVPSGRNYTLNMNGHMINRNLGHHVDYDSGARDDGEVILVYANASLTINGGDASVAHIGSCDKGPRGYNQQWHYTGDTTDKQSSTIYGGLITGGSNDGNGGGIYISGDGAHLTLNNVTIAGNIADKGVFQHHGGGVYIGGNNVTFTMNNSEVKWNYAKGSGGGLYLDGDDCTFSINNSEVSSNRATGEGGGIYLNTKVDLTLENSKVNSNAAGYYGDGGDEDAQGAGGGIYIDANNSKVTLNNSEVNYNVGYVCAGGVYMDGQFCELTLNNSHINSNHGDRAFSHTPKAGGVYINGQRSTLTLTNNSTIDGNSVNDYEAVGGGICVNAKWATIISSDSSISDNYARGEGGGIYVDGSNGTGATFRFENTKVNTNMAQFGNGGGLFIESGGLYSFKGCTISGNYAAGCGGGFYLNHGDITLALESGTTVDTNSSGHTDDFQGYYDTVGHGGGIYAEGDGLKIRLNNAKVQNNTANRTKQDKWGNYHEGSGCGGGIYARDGVSISSEGIDGVLSNNTAGGDGGGIWFSGELTLDGINVTNNTANGVGGGVHCDNTSYYTFVLKHFANITSNYSAGGTTLDNLYMKGKQDVCGGTGDSALSKESTIGVTVGDYKGNGTRRITGNQATLSLIGNDYASVFTSDVKDYYVLRDGNYLYLGNRYTLSHAVTANVGSWSWESEVGYGKEIILDTSDYLTYTEQEESEWGKTPDGSIISRVSEWTYLDTLNTIDYWTVSANGKVIDTLYPAGGKVTYTMADDDLTFTAHVLRPIGSAEVQLDESNTSWDALKFDVSGPAVSVSLRDRFFTMYPNGYLPAAGNTNECLISGDGATEGTWVTRKWVRDTEDTRTVEYVVNVRGTYLAKNGMYGNYQAFVNPDGQQPNPYQQLNIMLPDGVESYTIDEARVESLTDYSEYLIYTVTYTLASSLDVTFDAGEGTIEGTSSSTKTVEVNVGEAIGALPNANRENYVLDGWYDGLKRVNAYSTFTDDTTLNASWLDESPNRVRVYFVDGNTTLDIVNVEVGARVEAPTGMSKTGYTLEGWYTDSDLTEAYDFSQPVTDGLILYSKWVPLTYKVTFNAGQGTIETPEGAMHSLEQTVTYGNTACAVSTPVREGYTFLAWQVNGADYDFTTPVTGNIELQATWEKSAHTAYFVSEGKVVATQNFATGEPIEVPTIDARDGYILSGWYTDEALTRRFDFSNCSMTSDIVLYANWEEMLSVTFDSAGGESVDTHYTRAGLTLGALPHPVREHYSLVGWFDKDGNEYTDDTIIEKSVNLTAQWASDQVRIYYFDGDDTLDIQSVNYGTTITELMTPSKEGYIFLGWYLDEELTQPFVYGEEVTESIDVYAKWEQTQPVTPDDPDDPDDPVDPVNPGEPDDPDGSDDTGASSASGAGSKGTPGTKTLAATGDSALLIRLVGAGVLLSGCALALIALLRRRARE